MERYRRQLETLERSIAAKQKRVGASGSARLDRLTVGAHGGASGRQGRGGAPAGGPVGAGLPRANGCV